MARDICPITRKRCLSADICRMIYCGKSSVSARRASGVVKPIAERDLTKEEQYALRMAEQKCNQ